MAELEKYRNRVYRCIRCGVCRSKYDYEQKVFRVCPSGEHTAGFWANFSSGRVALAREVEALLEGEQLMLVDELTPESRNNPLWCSYGPAPNSGYLIDRTGKLRVVNTWIDVSGMEETIDAILAE